MEGLEFCQSCATPLSDEMRGTNEDGSVSKDYCKYCFESGRFTAEMTMEQMIDFCAPHMAAAAPGMKEEEAREKMREFFPKLKRWA